VLGAVTSAQGATVIYQAGNTDIHMDATYSDLEDPAGMLRGGTVLEHRDAGYPCDEDGGSVRYEDWTVNDPCTACDDVGCIDGYRNEIWLRSIGDAATTTTTRPSTAVSIHLYGDGNDGLAEVLVDNCRVAELDMFTSPGGQQALIIVYDLPFATHEITVTALDSGDVAVMGATAITCPDSSCSIGRDSNETKEDVATIDYGDDFMQKTMISMPILSPPVRRVFGCMGNRTITPARAFRRGKITDSDSTASRVRNSRSMSGKSSITATTSFNGSHLMWIRHGSSRG